MPRPVSVDVADLQKLLEQKNLYVHKYDLSGLRDTTLRVVCQIDEYIGRASVKTLRRAVLGNVYSAWDSTYVTTLSLHFVPLSDSTASLHCGMKERGQVGTFLRFRKAEPDFKYYNSYRPKPFTPCGLKPGEMVPVMLFGAYWYDADLSKAYGAPVSRFCMEPELDPEMTNTAFDRMPHYWVVRIGVEKREP